MAQSHGFYKPVNYIITQDDRRRNRLTSSVPHNFSEMVGGLKHNGDNKNFKTIAAYMLRNAILYAPSMVGKKVFYDELNVDKRSFSGFATYLFISPIKGILKLAWPSSFSEVFRGWADIIFPLRMVHVLFYGLTTCLEAGFRGLGALFLQPIHYAFTGNKTGWRILGLLIGLPLAFIAQTLIFMGNALQHARFVGDSILNIIPSFLSLFTGGYGTKFPELMTCVDSFCRNFPFLFLDVLVIAACLVPGGQIAPFLGNLIVPLGNFFGGLIASTTAQFAVLGLSHIGASIAASTFIGSTIALVQNLCTAVLQFIKRPSDFARVPILKNLEYCKNKIEKWENDRDEDAGQNINEVDALTSPSSNKETKVNNRDQKYSPGGSIELVRMSLENERKPDSDSAQPFISTKGNDNNDNNNPNTVIFRSTSDVRIKQDFDNPDNDIERTSNAKLSFDVS